MIKVCAWCSKQFGDSQHHRSATAHITHSICAECADNLDFQLGVPLKRYIDSFNIPIIVLGTDGKAVIENAAALLRKETTAGGTVGNWIGKVYECAHARLPDRCRQKLHCNGCAIRFSVTDTYRSGNSHLDVPALLDDCSADASGKVGFHISTSKQNGIVYLSIISVEPTTTPSA